MLYIHVCSQSIEKKREANMAADKILQGGRGVGGRGGGGGAGAGRGEGRCTFGSPHVVRGDMAAQESFHGR